MKRIHWCLILVLAGTFQFVARAQSNPGPSTGGGINRSYDDGFVYVDNTGNAGGYTSFWAYQDSSQIVGGFLLFHSESYLDANTIQLITDSYDISGISVFPPAPYSGSPSGIGPTIRDVPFSRSIESIAVPEPTTFAIYILAATVLLCRKRSRR